MCRFTLLIRLVGVAVAAAALASGCIKNDLPYPRIQQNIIELSAEGEISPAAIDSVNLSATVYLGEYVNLKSVHFNTYVVTEGAESDPNLLSGGHDLSHPIVVTLSRYQSYQWVVTARQTINRYFTVAGQIGETVIDEVGRRIIVKVPDSADLSDLTVTSVRLGPEGVTTMSPDIRPGSIDLSRPLVVDVTRFGESVEWTIYAERTALSVETVAADPWSKVVWVYGQAEQSPDNGFQYRRADSSEWIAVPSEYVDNTSGAFSCRIPHLEPLTEYVVRAVHGDESGNEISVTTQDTMVLPDGSFDQWWLDGKCWNPWDENGTRFWDTGNTGASTLGQSNVTPSDDTPSGSGKSACLETRFVGIAGIGKLAAGSIYTGVFAKVDGTNGILDFGRPWNLRPVKLHGYYKFHSNPIDYAAAELEYLKGRPDSCHIFVALTDWTEPFQVRTNPKNRNLFDKNAPYVIGYGELVQGDDTDGWQPFEIEIKYRSTSIVPTYIQITCAASKYGDYFTGGTGTVLYVDQLSLSYDY